MRKIIVCTFIIFFYNVFLLILPVILFLAFVKWSNPSSLYFLTWIYFPFILLSPLLSITMGYIMIKDRVNIANGLIPVITIFIGCLPIFGFYRFINSLWIPVDYLLFLGIPILLGLIADFIAASIPALQGRSQLNS